jgi:hypothetical protein
MDAVFGEDEREEAFENESERASLMSNARSISSRNSRRKAGTASQGWVSRIMGRSVNRANYEPIAEEE